MYIYAIELLDDQEVIKNISDTAFTTYRNATQYLLKNGYELYAEEDDINGGWELFFEKEMWDKTKWYMKSKVTANIIRLELT